ncbi:MAG TPA: ribonuclease E/G [Candidatus Acidoferrales bacterium]|nr:ribonuclease E/G [Candidatus Acidoferrales bacterium]
MPKTMLINVTHAEESRVGIVEDGVLASFEIEAFSREHLKGNIYKGVVHRIHPALEAAFVDIGAERDAFLPLDEICFRHLPTPWRNGGSDAEGRRKPRIRDLLKPGEEILVQIVKEQFANKPPTLSTFYSLPGRYLVLLPGSDEAGISRKIEGNERARIRELIERLNPPEGFGIIVRTAAGFDEGSRELHRDLSYLLRLWETIQQAAASKRAPALIYREHDLVLRTIRDYFTPDVDEIYIDNEEVFQRARDFLRDVMPGKEEVLHLYRDDQPIFSHFNVETQIESIYKRRVPLKSGGGIVIDGTEALTAIDVNSGRSIRGGSQEETAFRTNVEAATEIARQLRLRDVGGLIVIDFIDMRSPQHCAEVEKTLREAMRQDKARHDLGRISHFGLLEISRQRLRPAIAATTYTACPMCEGHGLVRTTESAALVALRKIHNRIAQGDVATLRVSVPPEVGLYLLNQKRDDLAQLERRYATRIQVAPNAALMPHQSEIEVRTRIEAGQPEQPQIRLGGVAPIEPTPLATGDNGEMITPAATEASTGSAASVPARAGTTPGETPTTGKRRRRRRGRRRGRGRQAAAAIGEALAALGAHTSLARERRGEAAAPAPPMVAEIPSVVTHPAPPAQQPEITPAPVSEAPAAPEATAPPVDASPRKPRARRPRAGTAARKRSGSQTRKQAATSAKDTNAAEQKTQKPAAAKRSRTRRARTASRSRRARSQAAPSPESPS